MAAKFNINIPKPCHENWQEMSVTDKGRFCSACQKNVNDFTNTTDAQIIKALHLDRNLCGRFTSAQLDRDLVQRKEKGSIWLATTSAVISFLSLTSMNVTAQENTKTEQTDKKIDSLNFVSEKETSLSGFIEGTVSEGGLLLPGVSVVVKGTVRGTQTNMDGQYSIKAAKGETLVFNFLGMKTHEHILKESGKVNIIMQVDQQMLLGEIVVGNPRVRRTFFGRTFHKIGNWFR